MLNQSQYHALIANQVKELDLPMPDDEEIEFSFQNYLYLAEKIKASSDGLVAFSDFVQGALYNVHSGYYTTGKDLLGAKGDFVTAPEISEIFAKAVGKHLQPALKATGGKLIEFGAGSGKLAAQLLQMYSDDICEYQIIDVSPALKEMQVETLRSQPFALSDEVLSKISWRKGFPEVELEGVILANELLDAIPAHRFRFAEGVFQEEAVALNDMGQFERQWTSQLSTELSDWLSLHRSKVAWEDNVIYEAAPWRSGWLKSVANSLSKGMLLFIDYGYVASDFFNPNRALGSLQCFYRHRHHDRYWYLTGLQDITTHVNFSELCHSAEAASLNLVSFCSQTDFILSSGILSQVEQSENTAERIKHSQAIQQLMMPGQMGEVVKAIAFERNIGQNAAPLMSKQRNSRL
ncbi:class I SAM-dependent methyltransferase [Pleionea sediminis]|uniref:class I SAM-dependent methyltransferase n=1 Tax=Pleionea sediminis TaxID=2569479 RepID=UPI001184D046|nr:SAM-dependent methyltransferase [Pleionea sediminis]